MKTFSPPRFVPALSLLPSIEEPAPVRNLAEELDEQIPRMAWLSLALDGWLLSEEIQ